MAGSKLPSRGRCLRLLAERCLSRRRAARHPAREGFEPAIYGCTYLFTTLVRRDMSWFCP